MGFYTSPEIPIGKSGLCETGKAYVTSIHISIERVYGILRHSGSRFHLEASGHKCGGLPEKYLDAIVQFWATCTSMTEFPAPLLVLCWN